MILSNNVSDANNDIDIGLGGAVVSYNNVQIRQYTNTSRQVYLTLTVGVNPSTPSTLATIGWNDYQIPRIG